MSLPTIMVSDRQLREVSDQALLALQRSNKPPFLFVSAGRIVEVVLDEKQRHVIKEVKEHVLRGCLTRSANYFEQLARGRAACSPPIDVVRDILAQPPAKWRFEPLDAVAEAPILRPDGSILQKPGYDRMTQLYDAPDPKLRVPAIPDNPSRNDVIAALDLINQAIGEFPFVDKELTECASRANVIAAMLTPMVKPAINSPAPMGLIDAPQQGTGKSLIADVIAIIVTGRAGEMLSAPRDEDEWRKQITTALLNGTLVVIIDNVVRPLDNPDLCKVLTETFHSDRAFRTHQKLVLPVRSTFFATGNNIRVAGDMPRRCYWIRIDAETSRPFMRTGFRVPDLKRWAFERRGELLAALLTLVRAWFVAGEPKPTLAPLGGYEAWSVTVGGILEFAGVLGFLGNSRELYEKADTESLQWEGFLLTLHEVFGDEPFTVARVIETLKACKGRGMSMACANPPDQAKLLRASLPDSLAAVADREGFFQRRLGHCLADRVGRRFGNAQVYLNRGEMSHNVQEWLVVIPAQSSQRSGVSKIA